MNMNNPPTEAEVRALRDKVFGAPITDNEWQTCRSHWMKPIETAWLVAHDFPIRESLQRRETLKKSC